MLTSGEVTPFVLAASVAVETSMLGEVVACADDRVVMVETVLGLVIGAEEVPEKISTCDFIQDMCY